MSWDTFWFFINSHFLQIWSDSNSFFLLRYPQLLRISTSCANRQQQQKKPNESDQQSSSGGDKKPNEGEIVLLLLIMSFLLFCYSDDFSILKKAILWASISAALTVFFLMSTGADGNLPPLISWNEFLYNMLSRGEVSSILLRYIWPDSGKFMCSSFLQVDEILIQPDRNAVLVVLADGAIINGRPVSYSIVKIFSQIINFVRLI